MSSSSLSSLELRLKQERARRVACERELKRVKAEREHYRSGLRQASRQLDAMKESLERARAPEGAQHGLQLAVSCWTEDRIEIVSLTGTKDDTARQMRQRRLLPFQEFVATPHPEAIVARIRKEGNAMLERRKREREAQGETFVSRASFGG